MGNMTVSAPDLQTLQLGNGETIAYRKRSCTSEAGNERIALLLHGNMSSSLFWDTMLERFPEAYTVFALDLRGFGGSSYTRPVENLSDFAEDVKLFVESLELRTFDLIGWSMGGGVAMQYAAVQPERVRKLVLMASISTRGVPYFGSDGEGRQRLRTREEIASLSKSAQIMRAYEEKDTAFLRELWNRLIYTRKRPETRRYAAYLEEMLKQRNLLDAYAAMNRFNISRIDHDAGAGSGQASSIRTPALVLQGDDDRVIPMAMASEIIEDIGNEAKLVVLDDCGHAPQEDRMERVMHEISSFLSEDKV